MKLPPVTLANARLVLLGRYHVLVLQQLPETSAMAEGFAPVLADLEAAGRTVTAAQEALLPPRVKVAVAEALFEAGIRQLHAQARIEDGGKDGPLTRVLFPDGLTPVVQPVGQRQVDAVDALLLRAQTRKLGEHQTLAPRLEVLKTLRDRYAGALDERKAATARLAEARAADMAAREQFIAAYSKDAGLLRSLYPSDRARQELFFDRWDAGRSSEAEPDEEVVAPDGVTVA